MRLSAQLPLPHSVLVDGSRDWGAESDEWVEDGNADFDLCSLSVEDEASSRHRSKAYAERP